MPRTAAPGCGRSARPPVRQAERLLRSGSTALSVALVINGVADYIFLTASGRALGPDLFTQISVLWAVLFLVGNGLYIPVEQELGRSISARRARGIGYGSLVRRVSIAAGSTFAVVAVVMAAFEWKIAEALFRGNETLVWVLIFGIFGVAAMFLVRGWLAGTSRFHSYAAASSSATHWPRRCRRSSWSSPESATRWPTGSVMGASALVGCAVPLSRPREPMEPGPAPAWSPLMSSLGWLLITSLLSALAMNIGTIAVEVLARPSEGDRAGVFLSGLVIARIPLFLFQGIQALVLPKLSHQAASGDIPGLRSSLSRLLTLLAGVTVVATIAAAWLGPIAVRVLFGEDFALLGGRDMALLTLASLLMMGALTINQAQIALHHQHQTGWPWGAACIVFVITAAVGGEGPVPTGRTGHGRDRPRRPVLLRGVAVARASTHRPGRA